jgi:hypothetical protein
VILYPVLARKLFKIKLKFRFITRHKNKYLNLNIKLIKIKELKYIINSKIISS